MKNKLKITILLLIVVLLAVGINVFRYYQNTDVLPTERKATAANTKTVTRANLENAVVGTALQYLYKRKYSDYEQKQMDARTYINSNGKVTANSGTNTTVLNKYAVTYPFRSFNTNPEGISRTNQFFIDCSSFSMSVYLNTLNFDFSALLGSEFKNQNISFAKDFDNKAPVTITTTKQYKTSYKNGNTRVLATSILNNAMKGVNKSKPKNNTTYSTNKNKNLLNNKYIVYYRELNDTRTFNSSGKVISGSNTITYQNEKQIYDEMKSLLRPGDLIVRRKGVEGEESGHVVIFVGNKVKVLVPKGNSWVTETHNYGIIEAKGGDLHRDYTFSNNGSTSGINKDNSIRYTEDFDYMIFDSNGIKSMKYLILRPLNEFCPKNTKNPSDNCTLSGSHSFYSNTISTFNKAAVRTNFHDISSEQYIMSEKGKTIGQYNMIRSGSDVRVRLRESKSNNIGFGFCASKTAKSIYNAGTQVEVADPVDDAETSIDAEKENDLENDVKINTSMTKSGVGEKACNKNTNLKWKRLQSNFGYTATDKVTVSIDIPSWGNFVKCSDNCTKTKSGSKITKLTWKNLSFNKVKTIEYTLDVQGGKGRKSVPGFKITKGSNTLSLPNMDIVVNSSIRSKDNREEMINSIKNVSSWSNQFDGINKVYQKFKYWSKSSYKRNTNYKVFDSSDVNSLLASYFSKINGSPYDYQLNTNRPLVVPGMYGGKLLRGNDARHASSGNQKNINRIKYMTEADFELGDVILAFRLNMANSTKTTPKFNGYAYIYYGHGKFVRFSDKKYTYHNQDLNSSNKLKVTQYSYNSNDLKVVQNFKKNAGWDAHDYFLRNIYNTDLFVVIRPIIDSKWSS